MNRSTVFRHAFLVVLAVMVIQTMGCDGGDEGAGQYEDVYEDAANTNDNGNENAANDNDNDNDNTAGPTVEDPWTSPADGGSMQAFEAEPIPAGFFDFDGRSCEEFSGQINLEGVPIDESELGTTDTIVERAGDPIQPSDPVGTEREVAIEIVALSLASTEPITVMCGGEPTQWNAVVDLSDTAPPASTLTATKEHDNGGTAEAVLNVHPRLTFTNVDDPTVQRVLDPGADGGDPIEFHATIPWIHSIDPDDPSLPKKFILGSDGSGAAQASQAVPEGCEIVTIHTPFNQPEGFGAQHLHAVCPPDTDVDGWHDGVDNCRTVFNRDQADSDGNGVGDACEPDGDGGPSPLGAWADALGNYLMEGFCPGSGTIVSLVNMDDTLVLRFLAENDDISLTIDDVEATGSDVTAFDTPGHDLTMSLQDGAITFHLEMPNDPLAFCDATLTPAPLDRDCFQSTGRATVTLDVADTQCASGVTLDLASAGFDSAVVELDPPRYTTDTDVDTELVQLELAADVGGDFGQIIIREREDKESPGRIENVAADDSGEFVSGDSFFDIFVEVEITGIGLTLDTGDSALRLDTGIINELPPLNTDYLPPPDAEPVPLFTAGTSDQVGWLCHAQHTPTEVVPCD